ncbi:hypothetical protein DIKCMJMK_01056 [Shewanella oneidensis]|nr:ParA family protein [Shewanella oneidensis]MEE2027197.1 hypothetical protein [Shewanella oneidensis]
MKIISVINYKGGVGKTTVTANIAAELARRNKRVLLLDMDAQATGLPHERLLLKNCLINTRNLYEC